MTEQDFSHLELSNINFSRGSNVSDNLLCLMCNKIFKNSKTLATHQINNKCLDTKVKLSCNFCKNTFVNETTLNTHLTKHHKDDYVDNAMNFNYGDIIERIHDPKNINNTPNNNSFLNDFHLNDSPLSLSITPSDTSISNVENDDTFQKKVTVHLKNNLNFIICLLNINSILYKFGAIKFILDDALADIFVFNETKLDKDRCDSEFQHPKYNMLRRDRDTGGGGGIIVYVSKAYETFDVCHSTMIESINFSIKFGSRYIGFIAAYRPPHTNNQEFFFNTLVKKVNDLDKKNNEIIIIGDLNYNMLGGKKTIKSNKLLDFMNENGFKNTNKKVGTRWNTSSKVWTLLDVIICFKSTLRKFINCTVFPFALSDHAMVVNMFNFKKKFIKNKTFISRSLSPKNIAMIRLSFANIFVDSLGFPNFKINHNNVEGHWSVLKDLIISVLDKISPKKTIKTKSQVNVPWFDKDLVHLARIRDQSYHKMIAQKNDLSLNKKDRLKFQEAKTNFQATFKRKKFNHFNKVIESQSVSSKKLWKSISSFINPNKKSQIIPNLILKGHSNNTALDAANCFVNFFASVINKFTFLPLISCFIYINHFFKKYIKIPNNTPIFNFKKILPNEVLQKLQGLEATSSKGEVGIETKIFKECANELSIPLADLFNSCIKNNYMPTEWKLAHLTPNHKGKGSKSDINNYRPLSVLSPIAKVYESLLAERISNFFESNNLLYDTQFGFRKGLSCELALNTFIDKIRQKLELKEYVIAIFLDLSKAFDTISHKILLLKLKYYNFSPSALSLVENYLSDRTMKVNLNGTFSKTE